MYSTDSVKICSWDREGVLGMCRGNDDGCAYVTRAGCDYETFIDFNDFY